MTKNYLCTANSLFSNTGQDHKREIDLGQGRETELGQGHSQGRETDLDPDPEKEKDPDQGRETGLDPERETGLNPERETDLDQERETDLGQDQEDMIGQGQDKRRDQGQKAQTEGILWFHKYFLSTNFCNFAFLQIQENNNNLYSQSGMSSKLWAFCPIFCTIPKS